MESLLRSALAKDGLETEVEQNVCSFLDLDVPLAFH